MATTFCPICGDIMTKVPMTIGGETNDYWVCGDCGYEAPASITPPAETEAVADEADQ